MYTNRKLLANQQAAEREKFYCEKAYEYTLRADSAEKILRRYDAMLDEFRKIRTAHEYSPEKSKLAVDIFNSLIYAIKTTAEESGCVRMVLYFAEWKIYMLKEPIFYGKEMRGNHVKHYYIRHTYLIPKPYVIDYVLSAHYAEYKNELKVQV